MIQPRLVRISSVLAGSLALAIAARAQPAASKPADETVTLSEFTVKETDENRGYVAAETMTGSRVATKIVDLPYTVNVLTSEFFEDFAMFELDNNLTQIGSFSGLDIGGGFTLRGFSATSQLRDGFYRLGRYGSSNIDRMEIIKGSNAAIYGRTSPGGMVNFISKAPKDRESYKLTVNYGDLSTQRGTLEATGPLANNSLGKISYIFTASEYQRGFDQSGQDLARNHNHEYYLAVKDTFKDGSSLMLSAEYFLQERHSPTSAAPLVIDQKGTAATTDDIAVGYASNLAKYNAYGPNSELNRGNVGFNGIYEKRFSDVWSFRAAGNYYRARRWDYNQNTGFGTININPSTGAAPTTTRGATPNKGLIFEDGGGIQADVLAHYWLGNHSIENRTLVTLDINDYYRYDPTWNYGPTTNADIAAWNAAGSGRIITLDPVTLTPTANITYFPKFFQWGNEQLTRLTRRRTSVFGGLLRHQAAFFQGRLLAFAGARVDAVRFQERDYTTAASSFTSFPGYANYVPGQAINKRVNQVKPNVGVNYKLTPSLRVFANYSESYFVNQTDNPVVFADPTYKPEIANGYDYGFKGALLNDKLNFTVSGFYAIRENVSVSSLVETPVGSGNYVVTNIRDGDQLVRGWEIDANYAINSEFSILGSWGHVYSIYTDFGSASPLAVGRRVNGVPPDNGSISVRYTPTGMLKGFSANLGWTYVGSTPSEVPNAGDVYATVAGQRVLTSTNRQWALRTPSYGLWNAGVRYAFRTGTKFGHSVGVNVNNAFDAFVLRGNNKNLGDGRAVFVTYSLQFSGRH